MRNKLRRISRIVVSKSFIGSVLFSAALWFYTTLNSEINAHINVPLLITLPDNRAIENDIVKTISVKVKGTGWYLLNALYFNASARCLIDLTGENIRDSLYEITRNDFMKSLQNLNNLEAQDIEDPKTLFIKTGKVGQYSILVEPDITIIPREGFMLVGDVLAKPDLINISGNDMIVRKIQKWRTKNIIFSDVFEPLTKVVPLSDSLKNTVNLSEYKVRIVADIQKISEIKLCDIKIKINGADIPREHKIIPEVLTVTIRGGIDQISNLERESIIASLNAADIVSDTLGILIPKISTPQNVVVLSIDPPYLRHVKRSTVNAETRFVSRP
jgi:hypothetical protein